MLFSLTDYLSVCCCCCPHLSSPVSSLISAEVHYHCCWQWGNMAAATFVAAAAANPLCKCNFFEVVLLVVIVVNYVVIYISTWSITSVGLWSVDVLVLSQPHTVGNFGVHTYVQICLARFIPSFSSYSGWSFDSAPSALLHRSISDSGPPQNSWAVAYFSIFKKMMRAPFFFFFLLFLFSFANQLDSLDFNWIIAVH